MSNETSWEEEFDRRFTVTVTHQRWTDELEPQLLPEPVYRFKDYPNTHPKVIKDFIGELMKKRRLANACN